ncbi:MAG: SMI1/KNR4 family protein [Candidatus Parabeggiatoa sp.]|nr:SMI1/KNR4 family protein [Candidatus Parabeggiatoa sp.]
MNGTWEPNTGATEDEISKLVVSTSKQLPEEYVNLLRTYNGGEGDLALDPMWLQLWPINDVVENNSVEPFIDYPDYFFFASNGGMESIAFKLGRSNKNEMVMIDLIAGIDSCTIIATDFSEFISAIGNEIEG